MLAKIALLDPLLADAPLSRLPEMNRLGDLSTLVQTLRSMTPSEQQVSGFDPPNAAAAMRDLGMLLASIRRHGEEPLAAVPELTPRLHQLAAFYGMVPRDTVFHYGPWNPRGDRERLFTADPRERVLIESTRIATPMCLQAGHELARAALVGPQTPAFVEWCQQATRRLQYLAHAMVMVRKEVDGVFFARELRPYFDDIDVGGKRFLGPAAASMPLVLVDHFLWASDLRDASYRSFADHLLVYGLSQTKDYVGRTLGHASIVTQVAEAKELEQGALEAVDDLLTLLLRFRGKHKALADEAYHAQVRLFPAGSGGYTPETLAHVLSLTLTAHERLAEHKAKSINRNRSFTEMLEGHSLMEDSNVDAEVEREMNLTWSRP